MSTLDLAAVVLAVTATATSADGGAPLRVVADGPSRAFDQEILSLFAKAQGRAVESVSGTPGAVASGLADVAAGLYRDALPTADLAATEEVFPSRLVAVTRRPKARATAIESLRWSRVGGLRGDRSPAVVHDSKISGAELSEYPSLEAALAALRAGGVSSLLMELPDALAVARRDPDLELGVFVGTRRSRVYVVRGGDRTLLAELNAYLRSLHSSPSWRSIVERHYGSTAFETLWRARLAD